MPTLFLISDGGGTLGRACCRGGHAGADYGVAASLTGRYLSGAATMLQRTQPRKLTGKWLTITGAREHNLQDVSLRIRRRDDRCYRRERKRKKHPH